MIQQINYFYLDITTKVHVSRDSQRFFIKIHSHKLHEKRLTLYSPKDEDKCEGHPLDCKDVTKQMWNLY